MSLRGPFLRNSCVPEAGRALAFARPRSSGAFEDTHQSPSLSFPPLASGNSSHPRVFPGTFIARMCLRFVWVFVFVCAKRISLSGSPFGYIFPRKHRGERIQSPKSGPPDCLGGQCLTGFRGVYNFIDSPLMQLVQFNRKKGVYKIIDFF